MIFGTVLSVSTLNISQMDAYYATVLILYLSLIVVTVSLVAFLKRVLRMFLENIKRKKNQRKK